MGNSQINQLFCLHDTKHYWFYFFKEYLELISYSGIVGTHQHVNKENNRSNGREPWAMGNDVERLKETKTQSSFLYPHLEELTPFKNFSRVSICCGQRKIFET